MLFGPCLVRFLYDDFRALVKLSMMMMMMMMVMVMVIMMMKDEGSYLSYRWPVSLRTFRLPTSSRLCTVVLSPDMPSTRQGMLCCCGVPFFYIQYRAVNKLAQD